MFREGLFFGCYTMNVLITQMVKTDSAEEEANQNVLERIEKTVSGK